MSQKKICLAILCVLSGLLCAEPVWQENFAKDGTPEDNGFQREVANPKDRFTVKDGVLTMICESAPYRGLAYRKSIPVLPVCEFCFDAKIAADGTRLFNHFSLKIKFGNVLISFNNPRWSIYHPSTGKYAYPCNVRSNEWHSFKIRFDAENHSAEYYMDNMETPVLVDDASEYDPAKGSDLLLANYGLAAGTVVNCVRNLKINRVEKSSAETEKTVLKGTMVFAGMSSGFWPLERIAKKFGDAPVSTYRLENGAHHVANSSNPYDLQPKPPVRTKTLPKCIILADMPLVPIPEYARKRIISAVQAGADLIVLNGFFTLNKGSFAGTELGNMLPVTVDDPWQDPQLKPGSTALIKNGKTAGAFWKQGRGRVIVSLECPSVKITDTVLFNNEIK